jgi:SsrA-binding protein
MPGPDILTNAKARRDYHVLETYEAGIVLHGTEVKALRAGKGQLADAFAKVEDGEVWLHHAHIDEYTAGNRFNHAVKGKRKLLLNRAEIRRLHEQQAVKGHALVPLSFYWKDGRIKVALAVGRGKDFADKRHDLKRRDDEREMQRALAAGRRR